MSFAQPHSGPEVFMYRIAPAMLALLAVYWALYGPQIDVPTHNPPVAPPPTSWPPSEEPTWPGEGGKDAPGPAKPGQQFPDKNGPTYH